MGLVQLIVLVVIFGLIIWLVQFLPLAEPFKTVAIVLMVLILILVLLGVVGLLPAWRVGPALSAVEGRLPP